MTTTQPRTHKHSEKREQIYKQASTKIQTRKYTNTGLHCVTVQCVTHIASHSLRACIRRRYVQSLHRMRLPCITLSYKYIHTGMHCMHYIHTYITLHCIALHYITVHYIHTYTHTHIHTYIHTYIHACIHTYIHTLHYITYHTIPYHTIHTYIHTIPYMHTYMHTCIRTYTTYTHSTHDTCLHTSNYISYLHCFFTSLSFLRTY